MSGRKGSAYCDTPKFDHYSIYRREGDLFRICSSGDGIRSDREMWIVGMPEGNQDPETITAKVLGFSATKIGNVLEELTIFAVVGIHEGFREKYEYPAEVLCSLLDLNKEVNPRATSAFDRVNSVVEFCRVYGLPVFDILQCCDPNNSMYLGFNVGIFFSDSGKIQRWVEAVKNSEMKPEKVLDLRSTANPRMLDHVDLRLELGYEQRDDGDDPTWIPTIHRKCSNMFELAKTEIFFSVLNKGYFPILECPDCGRHFEYDVERKKRQKYCDRCGTDAARQQRSRAKRQQERQGE